MLAGEELHRSDSGRQGLGSLYALQEIAGRSVAQCYLTIAGTPTPFQVPLEPEDVRAERQRVSDGDTAGSSIVIKDLVKIFPPTGGNP